MNRAFADRSLDALLKQVSRSFYLSLAVLPRAVRPQVSIAYLIARAADTIADTRLVAVKRRRALLDDLLRAVREPAEAAGLVIAVRDEIAGDSTVAAERLLLERLGECLALLHALAAADRARVTRVLAALATGMERDLARFPESTSPRSSPRALASLDELDEHCFLAAGCVGEFWTDMVAAHMPGAGALADPTFVARGVRLGKALQLVNVLRDAPADLAAGRCYLPLPLLAAHGLSTADLLDPTRRREARPILAELHRLALEHIDASWSYVEALPASAPRLRLACIWPLWIGLGTLSRLRRLDDPLDPALRVKVSRWAVYRLLAESLLVVTIDPLLRRAHRRRRRAAG